MHERDWPWMQRALALAERGRGYVEPNPLVGAVVVKDSEIIGEGWHQSYGEAHAEINALAAAGEAARGATLYVTLEPCCHHGKTPPCTEAVIRAGIRRVVAAIADPYPQVSGRSAEQLRAAGIPVDLGLGEAEARRLNAPYLKLLATGRPYVHAKWAMSLDGRIATRTGDSKWISNETSRRRVHELRGRMDAIILGIGSALADDPLLTARPPGPRTPVRIVLDSQARLAATSQLVKTAREVPTWIVCSNTAAPRDDLKAAGCQVIPYPIGANGKLSIPSLLSQLGELRFTNVLVEGGAEVLGSFRDADAIDEVHVFIAPRLIGGSGAKSPLASHGAEGLAQATHLSEWTVESLAGDLYIHAWRTPPIG
jgi:diaminohydroxyphosphoribosylaminopyrimidine deaminase/5-amino-6-(5-phosphoribosylamino)uracil reductase